MIKNYIRWELIRFALEKFGEWKILGDLSETAKKNEGMEKLFQEKVSSVVKENWHQNLFFITLWIKAISPNLKSILDPWVSTQ